MWTHLHASHVCNVYSLCESYSLSPGKRGSSSNNSSRHPSCELSPLDQCSTPPPRQRMLSEPWLAIHNLACLNRTYEEGLKERSQEDERNTEDLGVEGGGRENYHKEEEESYFHQSKVAETREVYNSCDEDFLPGVSQSLLTITEVGSAQATSSRLISERRVTPGASMSDKTTQKSSVDKLPACPPPQSQLRRNTLPSVMVVPPLLHLPPLVNQPDSHLQVPTQVSPSKSRSLVFLPHPPYSSPPSSSSRASSLRPALLPPLPFSSSVTSLVAPPATCCRERNRKSLRRHSVQLEQIRGERGEQTNHLDLWDWDFVLLEAHLSSIMWNFDTIKHKNRCLIMGLQWYLLLYLGWKPVESPLNLGELQYPEAQDLATPWKVF